MNGGYSESGSRTRVGLGERENGTKRCEGERTGENPQEGGGSGLASESAGRVRQRLKTTLRGAFGYLLVHVFSSPMNVLYWQIECNECVTHERKNLARLLNFPLDS